MDFLYEPGPRKYYVIVPLLLITLWLTLTMSGFCYKEMRYIPPRERIERIIENHPAQITYKNCRISDTPDFYSGWDAIGNALIFSRCIIQIECVYPQTGKEDPYYNRIISTDACGRDIIESTGIGISMPSYLTYMEGNEKYWKQKGL